MAHKIFRSAAWATILLMAPIPALAQPGLNQEPWSPPAHDQNSMAVVMATMDGDLNSGSSGAASGPTLVCGGGGGTTASTATANSTCIILNNSSGSSVGTGQESNGTQSSNSSSSTNTVTNKANTMSGALSSLVPGG